jgi:hypothetical protein
MSQEEINKSKLESIDTNNNNISQPYLDNKNLKYICENCNYNTSRKSQYFRHLETNKHYKKAHKKNEDATKVLNNFTCICENTYLYKSGLYKHKKKCVMINNNNAIKKMSNEELFLSILKDNQDFKQMLIEQNTKIMELTKNTNVITNNNNNTNFNLQMFLNVQCKDALNITEFVDSLQPKIEDLEMTGKLGYVEGISKIFLNGLQGLDINRRPIHCSDQKRETIYIKNNNTWEKENDNRENLKLAIKTIASKNIKQISVWQKENPDCFDSSSKKNDQYLRIVSNSMNGLTPEETQKNYDKIISKLVKEVVIQKE